MTTNDPNYPAARRDFTKVRAQASMEGVLAHLSGRSNELLSYEEVANRLHLNMRSERGVLEIPLKAIVGSVGRYTDFTRTFLPLSDTDRERWARVKAAMDAGIVLAPIDVYKVGEVYFVLDGNQRVSVARQNGLTYIQAHVIEVETDAPLESAAELDALIVRSEYGEFLDRTDIFFLRPGVNLTVTIPGQYDKLIEHIQAHRYFMGIDYKRHISYPEAISHWYDMVYLAIVEPIREHRLLRWFPGRTETDMYVWVSEHRYLLEKSHGQAISPAAAVVDLVGQKSPRILKETASRKPRAFDHYIDQLFGDILVPFNGLPESWRALEQAALVARKEKASLRGLHILPPDADPESAEALEIKARFDSFCEQVNVGEHLQDALTIVNGKIPNQICRHALFTDLVVLNVSHPPQPGIAGVGSGLRAIIWRAARPVLAVREKISQMDRVLLIYNGNMKSKEALFVAAYLADQWKISLTVLTLIDREKVFRSTQDYARSYLASYGIPANFMIKDGPLETILDVVQEQKINLLLIGGYNGNALKEVMLGSTVNFLLREAECPMLICR
jgi:nucleotide-binding universal stress UspA family protein